MQANHYTLTLRKENGRRCDGRRGYHHRLNFFYYSGGMLLYRERENHGITGLGWAWKHNTMDAAEASVFYAPFLTNVTQAVTDGLSSTWETYKVLRGEGFPRETISELFTLSNELNRLRLRRSWLGPLFE